MSTILNNRFYIGELKRNGQVHEGRYERLIDRTTFDVCQEIMRGRNRRTGNPNLAYSGGLFRCAHCGQAITGEFIRRRLRNATVREHVYYRCANNNPAPNHPKVRWRAEDVERAVATDLARMRIPSPEVAAWFRRALAAAFSDLTSHQRQQATALNKRKSELVTMQDRLLNAYLAGTVEEQVFRAKSAELKQETLKVNEAIENVAVLDPDGQNHALAVFDWSQNAAETWRGSNNALKREILDAICLNRTLSDVTLVTQKRKPFDVLAEGLDLKNSRGDWT